MPPKDDKGGKVFDKGFFKKHNQEVVEKIKAKKTIKEGVREYKDNIVADAKVLVDAGASEEQLQSSRKALDDQFDTVAWPAIVSGTNGRVE